MHLWSRIGRQIELMAAIILELVVFEKDPLKRFLKTQIYQPIGHFDEPSLSALSLQMRLFFRF
jgi:hypothetical protein